MSLIYADSFSVVASHPVTENSEKTSVNAGMAGTTIVPDVKYKTPARSHCLSVFPNKQVAGSGTDALDAAL